MLRNAGTVMLEPVRDQHWLPVCRLNQILQHFQLPAVNHAGFLVLVIYSAVAHLEQLIGQRCRIGRIDVAILKRDNQILLQLVVQLPFLTIHLDLMVHIETLRHLQVVDRLHGNGDIGYPFVDLLLGARSRNVGEYDTCCRIHRAGFEIGIPKAADETSQPLPAIQDTNLRPQVHQAVRCWCTCQSDPALHKWTYLPEVLESL